MALMNDVLRDQALTVVVAVEKRRRISCDTCNIIEQRG